MTTLKCQQNHGHWVSYEIKRSRSESHMGEKDNSLAHRFQEYTLSVKCIRKAKNRLKGMT
ncbi:hypothetical protein M514_02746 [Trichuris suis]|uniref:Uncharacterized protein n=1 Tax=Trichuris suis TaxID=68888 RepID=A0A085MGE5_9BILA|nr:hypothetical protein M513_02746 [Trichuris suis]KFD68781.1 hypothetical protein M514_02746 [Trichuris suis]